MSSSFLSILTFFSFYIPLSSSLNSDGLSLLALKSAIDSDPTHILSSWSEQDPTPCHWPGILCTDHRVTHLSLPNKSLSGYLPSELGLLNSLTHISLPFNNLSKPIPSNLFNATNLILIDLSHNSLSSQLPPQISQLTRLRHLDLSSNSLSGPLPGQLAELTHLEGTLNLSFNQFTADIPISFADLPLLLNLDLRHNNLSGKIPQVGSLLNQGPTAFSGNPNLCGFPLQTLCPSLDGKYPQNPNVVFFPENPKPLNANLPTRRLAGGSTPAIVAVVSSAMVAVVVLLTVWWLRRKEGRVLEGKMGNEENVGELEGQDGKFVVCDEGMNLELEDLLRASAYVVGKSRSGIVYRVVAGRGSGAAGCIVAVRRLNDGDATLGFKDFEGEMECIGRVQHCNILRLRAYYYASDEKLLVTDFVKNGSLYSALHGN